MKHRLLVISNAYVGTGLSGGDRITLEIIRHWQSAFVAAVIAPEEFLHLMKKNDVHAAQQVQITEKCDVNIDSLWQRLRSLVQKIRKGVSWACKGYAYQKGDIVYSSSDFWPDVLLALVMKWHHPELVWIAGFYLFAPKPWDKNSPYRGKNFLIGLLYYLSQLPMYFLVKRYADFVFITSEPDQKYFLTRRRPIEKIMVIQGFVCLHEIRPLREKFCALPKIYDGCFMARLHYQKGCLELIEIWRQVVNNKPSAQLAVIGDGPLKDAMMERVKAYSLEKNVVFLGTLLGEEKYRVFAQSRVMVHPATYDSGGMAMAEGMAFGLPGVSFDLEALKTYYPQGVIKTPCYDTREFAANVLKLLDDEGLYQRLSHEAKNLIDEVWDSEKRNKKLLNEVVNQIEKWQER